jgi:hypothetical protein
MEFLVGFAVVITSLFSSTLTNVIELQAVLDDRIEWVIPPLHVVAGLVAIVKTHVIFLMFLVHVSYYPPEQHVLIANFKRPRPFLANGRVHCTNCRVVCGQARRRTVALFVLRGRRRSARGGRRSQRAVEATRRRHLSPPR